MQREHQSLKRESTTASWRLAFVIAVGFLDAFLALGLGLDRLASQHTLRQHSQFMMR